MQLIIKQVPRVALARPTLISEFKEDHWELVKGAAAFWFSSIPLRQSYKQAC